MVKIPYIYRRRYGGGGDSSGINVDYLAGYETALLTNEGQGTTPLTLTGGTGVFRDTITTPQFGVASADFVNSDLVLNAGDAQLTGDWTIEGFFRAGSLSASAFRNIMGNFAAATDQSWNLWVTTTPDPKLQINLNSGVFLNGTTTINTLTWYHFVVQRRVDTVRMWVDGVYQGTVDAAGRTQAGGLAVRLGWNNNANTANKWDGNLDEIRITNGVARYPDTTANITVPTIPYPRPTIVANPTGPLLLQSPSISGDDANVGTELSARLGAYRGTGTLSYAYQWTRDGVDIGSATNATYTLVSADDGAVIRCEIDVTDDDATLTATSNGITAIGVPVNTVAPIISGTTETGEELSCTTGTWVGPATITYTYQWKANGSNISGATSSTYTLTSSEDNDLITCEVTATNSEGSASATSNELGPVTPVASPISVTGGTITTDGADQIHTFTSGGTLTVTGGSVEFTYLVVGGGGGGGKGSRSFMNPGGGGGGGVLTGTTTLSAGSYAITVGAGGAGAVDFTAAGVNGGDSSIAALVVALGGGGGASVERSVATYGPNTGGSGGGAGWHTTTGSNSGAAGTGGQGFAGGSVTTARSNNPGAGGGGAGGVGASVDNDISKNGGDGGPGVSSSISGSSVFYGGGGGGASTLSGVGGAGGSGGGGAGATFVTGGAPGGAGTPNTGGGGGGSNGDNAPASLTNYGGDGGSGIVIVRWTPA